jgi:RNA polymerase sigma-70 factor (ECF subfamily)
MRIFGPLRYAESRWCSMNRIPFDADYLARLRDGDPETERHFVLHFSNAIRLSLRYRLRSWQLIDDIRQETFLRVLNYLRSDKSMDHPERLGAYVHSVSINVMMELLRSSSHRPAALEDAPDLVDKNVKLEHQTVPQERKDLLRGVLEELSEKDRSILRAVFLEDIEKDEVCKRFEVSRDHLRVLVHRAKLRFRKALENKPASESKLESTPR